MVIKNNLDRAFGPFGSSTGFFLFIGGAIATYFSLMGLAIATICAFISFTSTSTYIDTGNKKIKFSNNIFGIIPIGKWIDIKPDMKLGINKSHHGYRAYTRGNQPVSIHLRDIRIFLYDSDSKVIMPVKKFSSAELSKIELIELSSILGLSVLPNQF
jgi:hypothetical protein